MGKTPTREEAYALLLKYNQSAALIRHALSVEGVMAHFAGLYNEDPEKWRVIGLLHDLDFERFPEQHCKKVVELLNEEGIDEEYIRSICSHGYGLCSDVEPVSNLELVLYTIDELTGLITAAALMRPSKSVMDIEYKSVIKKYKTPSFAAGVDRAVIENGAKKLNMDLKYAIEQSILGMWKVADSIGLG